MEKTILVIEEEPHLRLLFDYMLRIDGYLVKLAHDWKEAQLLLDREPPSLIIFDWALTNHNGYLWIDEIRTAPETAHIPVLLVCSELPPRGIAELLGNVGIPVIEKPFDLFLFLREVADLLSPHERMVSAGSL